MLRQWPLIAVLALFVACSGTAPAASPSVAPPTVAPPTVAPPTVAAPTAAASLPVATPASLPPAPPPISAPPATPAPATPSDSLEALLGHVPAEMQGDCMEVTSFDGGVLVSVQCINLPGIDGYVVYTQFDTLDNLNASFDSSADFFGEGAVGSDCAVDPSRGQYTIDGAPAGQLMCNTYTSDDPDGLISVWSHERLLIRGTLVLYGGTLADMYEIWLTAGPIDSGGQPVPTTSATDSQSGGNSWGDTATDFQGRLGEQFVYSCPGGGSAGSIWGTDTYTADSSVCTAAVHAGLITLAAGGQVTIEMRAGRSSYEGSERNGVTSGNWGEWSSSFVLVAP